MTKPLYTDPTYRQAMAYWQTWMATNPWTCRRCHKTIPAGNRSAWDLGHGNGLEPEHRTCNRHAGAVLGAARSRAPRHSRNW